MSDAPQRLRWFAEQFAPRRTARVLEVGCGNGQLLALLAQRHPQLPLVGIDRSVLQVRKATQRLATLPAPPRVLTLAIEDAARHLDAERFTHILAMNVNLPWTDPAVAGPALRALLAPRGTVLLGFEPPTPQGRARLHAKLTHAAATAGFTERRSAHDPQSATLLVEWTPRPRARTGPA